MYKTLTAIAAAAAMTLAVVAAPDQADARWRGNRHGGGIAAGVLGGLASGAIIGSMANQGYYYAPDYSGSGYYYGPGPYAYEPPPVYVRPAPRYYGGGGGCWIVTDKDRGYGYYGPCQ